MEKNEQHAEYVINNAARSLELCKNKGSICLSNSEATEIRMLLTAVIATPIINGTERTRHLNTIASNKLVAARILTILNSGTIK